MVCNDLMQMWDSDINSIRILDYIIVKQRWIPVNFPLNQGGTKKALQNARPLYYTYIGILDDVNYLLIGTLFKIALTMSEVLTLSASAS